MHLSCEIDDFVEIHIFKLCVMKRSRVMRGAVYCSNMGQYRARGGLVTGTGFLRWRSRRSPSCPGVGPLSEELAACQADRGIR